MKNIKFFGTVGMVAVLASSFLTTSCDICSLGGEKLPDINKITISSGAETIKVDSTFTLTYTVEPAEAKVESAEWSSSSEVVATVDQNGVVKGIAEGTATITITVNSKFTKTCAVTVENNIPPMTGITISSKAETIKVDSTFTLTYTVEPAEAIVESAEWSSSSEAVATVDQNGVVKGIAEGTATITITVNGKFTKTCAVTVKKNLPAMTGITISSEAETIKVDSTFTLTYTVEPAEAIVESAEWSSSSEAVATVDQNGVVKGIAEGTATITITVNGKFTKTCAVQVQAQTGLYSEVLALGKYMGKSLADTKSGLASEGWTVIQNDSKAYRVGKKVDGNDVDLELSGSGNSLTKLYAQISDSLSIANGTTVFNQIGETYKFETLAQNANFYYFWGELSDRKVDIDTYSESKEWLKNKADSCIAFQGAWITASNTAMSVEALKSLKIIEIQFQNVVE